MNPPTADDLIRQSEMLRSEQYHLRKMPIYSLERIRRRALCEAVCEGVPDSKLIAMRDSMRLIAMAEAREEAKEKAKETGDIVPLAELEKDAILSAVHKTGSMRKAAKQLGLSSNTMYRKMNEYRSSDLAVDVNPGAHRGAVNVNQMFDA